MSGVHSITAGQLKSYVERLESLEQQKSNVMEDISSFLEECKSEGFDSKVLRQIVKLRRMKPEERKKQEDQEEILQTYLNVLNNS